jgi:uncharacterized tellurite resistance protein B-like protein
MMETATILKDYTDQEKGAYLGAIASLATADHIASEEEREYISELCDAAELSGPQKEIVLRSATEITGEELQRCIDILAISELRFSLITELINFANSDGNYNEQEKANIEKIAQQLGINNKQFSLLDHFVTKASETPQPEKTSQKGFLDTLGLNDKFKEAGIDMSSLGKGLLAIAAPFFLGKLFMGGRNNLGNAVQGNRMGGMGGLGSIISALNMGRGFGNTGGLLSRILGRRF